MHNKDWTMRIPSAEKKEEGDERPSKDLRLARFLKNNFGVIDFWFDDEDSRKDVMRWEVRDRRGEIALSHVFTEVDFGRRENPDYGAYKRCVAKRGSRLFRRVRTVLLSAVNSSEAALVFGGLGLVSLVFLRCFLGCCCGSRQKGRGKVKTQ